MADVIRKNDFIKRVMTTVNPGGKNSNSNSDTTLHHALDNILKKYQNISKTNAQEVLRAISNGLQEYVTGVNIGHGKKAMLKRQYIDNVAMKAVLNHLTPMLVDVVASPAGPATPAPAAQSGLYIPPERHLPENVRKVVKDLEKLRSTAGVPIPTSQLYSLQTLSSLPATSVRANPMPAEVVYDYASTADTINMSLTIAGEGFNPCMLNMANSMFPGGAWETGHGTQEESLFLRTNYIDAVASLAKRGANRLHPERLGYLQPLKHSEDADRTDPLAVYSRDITVLPCNATRLAAIAMAAYDLGKPHGEPRNERTKFEARGSFDWNLFENRMMQKIRITLDIALANGHDAIVLGGLGCGAFRHIGEQKGRTEVGHGTTANYVAQAFARVLEEDKYKYGFRRVAFACPGINHEFGQHIRKLSDARKQEIADMQSHSAAPAAFMPAFVASMDDNIIDDYAPVEIAVFYTAMIEKIKFTEESKSMVSSILLSMDDPNGKLIWASDIPQVIESIDAIIKEQFSDSAQEQQAMSDLRAVIYNLGLPVPGKGALPRLAGRY